MNFLKVIKCVNERILRICGVTILQYGNRKIINGTLSYFEVLPLNLNIFNKIQFGNIEEFQILGFPLFQHNKENKFPFKIFPRKNSIENRVVQSIFNKIDKKYNGICLLRSALGESYLMNYLINSLCHKYKISNACFASIRAVCKEWECYTQIPLEQIDLSVKTLKLLRRNVYMQDGRFLFVCLPIEDIKSMVLSYKYGEVNTHHFVNLTKYFGLNKNTINDINPKFLPYTEKKCELILKTKDINSNKLIFISKDALSTENLPKKYWDLLQNKLEDLGYDLYFNSKELTISEACYMASLSAAVICNRSGFSEGLSRVAKKMFIFYTPMITDISLSPAMVMNFYSLKEYPGVVNPNNIYEYNTLETGFEKIVEDIANKLTVKEM